MGVLRLMLLNHQYAYSNVSTRLFFPFLIIYIQGSGCAYMCSWCAQQLQTDNYYWTSGVCTYQNGGCVGSPLAGVEYTCCRAS
jgi:hypothetical protein